MVASLVDEMVGLLDWWVLLRVVMWGWKVEMSVVASVAWSVD